MNRAADLDRYVEHLRGLPFVRAVTVAEREARPTAPRDYRPDAFLRVKTPRKEYRCLVEHKATHLTKEAAERIVHVARDVPGLLIFVPHVGRELGELFTRERVNFIDLAGNCHIRFDDQYIARIQGNAMAATAPADKGMRAPSYLVLLAFLVDEGLLDGTTRAIGAEAGVSPQTAADLRARLVADGVVTKTRRHHRWASGGRKRALELWLAGWSTTLFPHLLVGRFRAGDRTLAATEARFAKTLGPATSWRWGSGAAAQRLTGFYRGDRTVLYVAEPAADLPRRLALVPDRAGPISIVRAPGPMVFRSPNPGTVHPLLVYADLLAEGDGRAREAAAEIDARFLTPPTAAP